jgi:hypothetical protein
VAPAACCCRKSVPAAPQTALASAKTGWQRTGSEAPMSTGRHQQHRQRESQPRTVSQTPPPRHAPRRLVGGAHPPQGGRRHQRIQPDSASTAQTTQRVRHLSRPQRARSAPNARPSMNAVRTVAAACTVLPNTSPNCRNITAHKPTRETREKYQTQQEKAR